MTARSSSSLQGIVDRLFARRAAGIRPGLEVEQRLLRELGDPHRHAPVIHVAGTNGKGSVCAMMAAGLQAAGRRVGLYTSPHLVRLHERFRVNGEEPDDDRLFNLIHRVEEADRRQQARTGGRAATFFECSTAVAFLHFADAGADAVVLETGMGGRLDATNVVDPVMCVITTIDRDHTRYLGDTLPAIAAEKAGILKPSRPVTAGRIPPDAMQVIQSVAREKGCPLYEMDRCVRIDAAPDAWLAGSLSIDDGRVPLSLPACPLAGDYQRENAALAALSLGVAAARGGLEFDAGRAIQEGVPRTRWNGRMQWIDTSPPMILDGAHNPAAMEAFAGAIPRCAAGRPIAAVGAFLEGKEVEAMLRSLGGVSTRLWITEVRDPRRRPAAEVLGAARELGLAAVSAPFPQALEQARAWAAEHNGLVCVVGSLYLVGDTLEWLEHAEPGT